MDNQEERMGQRSAAGRAGAVAGKVFRVFEIIGKWIYRLRSIFLAAPVVVAAIALATKNLARLPEKVGLLLLADGTYQQMVSREMAVIGPLAVTGLCLLMMFVSRRVVYPWVISIFSLVLPFVIYITNVFPA